MWLSVGGVCEREGDLIAPSAVSPCSQVPFDRNKEGKLALCLEASHNRARIIHWKDHTGRAITESLLKVSTSLPNPHVLPYRP